MGKLIGILNVIRYEYYTKKLISIVIRNHTRNYISLLSKMAVRPIEGSINEEKLKSIETCRIIK